MRHQILLIVRRQNIWRNSWRRLRTLESAGLIFRDHEPTIPPKVTHGLTVTGAKIDKALHILEEVAEDWAKELD